MSELERVRELLPWHAMETLPAAEREFVAQWLQRCGPQHPEILAELAWLRSTATQLQAQAPVPAGMAEQGLEALMARVRADAAATTPVQQRAASGPQARPGLVMHRWAPRLREALLAIFRTPAGLALASVVLVQALVIGLLLDRSPASPGQLEPLGGSAGTGAGSQEVRLTVAFASGTTEAALRAVLLQAQARIVAGPSALGLYTVVVPAGSVEASLAALRAATGVVESVQR